MMFDANFKSLTAIESQAELQSVFKSDRVYLRTGGRVAIVGTVTLGSEVTLDGDCLFCDSTWIDNGSILTNVRLGRGNKVRAYSILSDLVAGDRNLFGPFCFIRDRCDVAHDCVLGAHTEATRSTFGSGVKVSHRAFIGDARIGEQTIIGAGVVFCNFDGEGRQTTNVGSSVTVGSGTLLVPPLTIGDNATLAAGSTVTKDVAAATMVIQKR